MDKLKYIKLEQPDGSYSTAIPLAVDSDHVDVNGNTLTDEINNKATKAEVQAVASGSPSGVYSTVSALVTADPDHNKIYLVSSDGHWYYYNNNQWNDGGIYQSTQVNDKSILPRHLSNYILEKEMISENIELLTETGGVNLDGTINSASYLYHSTVTIGNIIKIKHKSLGSNTICCAFYNGNDFINGVTSNTVSVNEYFDIDVPLGATKAILVSFFNTINCTLYRENLIVSENNTSFETSINFIKNVNIIESYSNIIDNLLSDSYINYQNGSVLELNNLYASDYILLPYDNSKFKIKTNSSVFKNNQDNRGLAFYDDNYNYISGYQYTINDDNELNLLAPARAKYFRFTLNNLPSNIEIGYIDLNDILNNTEEEKPLSNIIQTGGMMHIFQKICFIGDSLTDGVFEDNSQGTKTYDAYINYNYPTHLHRILNNTKQVQIARGGVTSKTWCEAFLNSNYLLNDENKCECYIIYLGTNDIAKNDSFTGNVSNDIDTTNYNNNADTSVGNYAKIIQAIKTIQPKAKIFCHGIDNMRNSTNTRTEANNKISAICELLDCYFMDFQTYGVQETDADNWRSIFYNGGHPNSLGYIEMGNMIASYIDYIIRNNPQEFNQIPFIESNKEWINEN